MLAADTGHALMTALLARTTHTMLQHAPTFLNILSPRQKLVARKLTDCNNYSSRTCRASDSWQSFCGERSTQGRNLAPAARELRPHPLPSWPRRPLAPPARTRAARPSQLTKPIPATSPSTALHTNHHPTPPSGLAPTTGNRTTARCDRTSTPNDHSSDLPRENPPTPQPTTTPPTTTHTTTKMGDKLLTHPAVFPLLADPLPRRPSHGPLPQFTQPRPPPATPLQRGTRQHPATTARKQQNPPITRSRRIP